MQASVTETTISPASSLISTAHGAEAERDKPSACKPLLPGYKTASTTFPSIEQTACTRVSFCNTRNAVHPMVSAGLHKPHSHRYHQPDAVHDLPTDGGFWLLRQALFLFIHLVPLHPICGRVSTSNKLLHGYTQEVSDRQTYLSAPARGEYHLPTKASECRKRQAPFSPFIEKTSSVQAVWSWWCESPIQFRTLIGYARTQSYHVISQNEIRLICLEAIKNLVQTLTVPLVVHTLFRRSFIFSKIYPATALLPPSVAPAAKLLLLQ